MHSHQTRLPRAACSLHVSKCWQDLSWKILIRRLSALKNNLLMLPLLFQVDLEPEGKVFVVITLTGSFTEGKGVPLACFHKGFTSGVCYCHQLQNKCHSPLSTVGYYAQSILEWLEVRIGLLLTSRAVVQLLCCCSDLGRGELCHIQPGLFIWGCPWSRLFLPRVLFIWVLLEGQVSV